MSQATVLYDVPGPRARVRNGLLTVLFVLVLVLVLGWVVLTLNSKFELAPSKWTPFFRGDLWANILFPALLQTLKAAALSLVIALPVGALLGLGRLSDHVWIRWPSAVVVEFFRAIPVLLMMVFATVIYTALDFGTPETRPLLSVVTGLVLYNGSVLAEVFRAGVLSLPRGQTEASLAIGLSKTQMLWIVLLPQALTVMLPAIVSQLVVIVKDTALGGQLLVAYPELLRSARNVTALYSNSVATYIVIALIFIIINFALSSLAGWLEQKIRTRRGGGGGEPAMQLVESGVVTAGGPTITVMKDRGAGTGG